MIAGPSSAVSTRSCQLGSALPASVEAWISRSTGLVSTRCTASASRKLGRIRVARSMSAISVPRPGPISIREKRLGEPIACQRWAAQSPIISPNIWLISGAVVKSPCAPKGSRVL